MKIEFDPDTQCESRHCRQAGVGYNDNGEWLCEDCLFEWIEEMMKEEDWSYNHTEYECGESCPNLADVPRSCVYCDGGLFRCTVCKGAEASLPEHCPGRSMSEDEQDAVAMGIIDFIDGRWIET